MSIRKIVSAKLTPTNRLHVDWLEIHNNEDGRDTPPDPMQRKGNHEAHMDLVSAFQDLKIHLATVCEQGQFTEYEEEPNKLDIFFATQISLGGEDEHEGVTITGTRQLKNNKVLNLNAPFVKLNPDHSDYSYVSSLSLVIETLLREVDAYLNGKYAPSNQLNLFDQDQETDEPEEEKKPAKKRGRKAKKLAEDEAHMSVAV